MQDEVPQLSDLYKAARYYAQFWHVIPVKPRSKEAAIAWRFYQDNKPQDTELWEWFQEWRIGDKRYTEQPNIACILGDFTVQLDFDGLGHRGGLSEWREKHPLLAGLPRVRTGSGKYHVFFRVAIPIQHHDIALDGGGVIEVRTGRNIAVLPPSIHPNGEPYVWEVPIPADGIPLIDPATVGVKDRPKLTVVGREYHEGDPLTEGEIDAIVALVEPHWTPNHRHALSLAIPGWLASIGAPEEDARTVVSRLSLVDGHDRLAEFQRSVRDTYVKAASAIATKGWSELRDTLDTDDLRQLEQIAKAHEPTFTLPPKAKDVTIPWMISARDFATLTFPDDEWLVDAIIPTPSLGMIAGEPGGMKSWLALQLSVCLALGEPLFGNFYVPDKRPIVYVQEENTAKTLQRRVTRLVNGMGYSMDDLDDRLQFITNQRFRFDDNVKDDGSWKRFCREVMDEYKPAMVTFDPMVEMHWLDENASKEMMPIMTQIKGVRDHYECVMNIVHHVNKVTDVSQFLYRIRGSSAIVGALDWCLGVIPEEGAASKSRLHFAKVRDGKKPNDVMLELIDNPDNSIRFAMYEGGSVAKSKPSKAFPPTEDEVVEMYAEIGQTNILTMMSKFEEIPPEELHTGSPAYKAAAAMVSRLVNKGRLEKVTYSTLPGELGKIFRATY